MQHYTLACMAASVPVGAHRCATEAPSEPIMRPKTASVVVDVAQTGTKGNPPESCAISTTIDAVLGLIIGLLGASVAHLRAPTENLQPCMQVYSVACDSFVTIFMATTIRNKAT